MASTAQDERATHLIQEGIPRKAALELAAYHLVGTADPSAGSGVAAPLGALYSRTNGTAGELWVKTGTGDTGWTKK